MAKKSYWPAPVYEGRFDGGEVIRMSFWSQEGKPVDIRRGYRLVTWAAGRKPVSGCVIFNDQTIPDLGQNSGDAIKPLRYSPKTIIENARRALEAGDVTAALAFLKAS